MAGQAVGGFRLVDFRDIQSLFFEVFHEYIQRFPVRFKIIEGIKHSFRIIERIVVIGQDIFRVVGQFINVTDRQNTE